MDKKCIHDMFSFADSVRRFAFDRGWIKGKRCIKARNDQRMNNTQRLNITCPMLIIWSVFKQWWGALTDPFTHWYQSTGKQIYLPSYIFGHVSWTKTFIFWFKVDCTPSRLPIQCASHYTTVVLLDIICLLV